MPCRKRTRVRSSPEMVGGLPLVVVLAAGVEPGVEPGVDPGVEPGVDPVLWANAPAGMAAARTVMPLSSGNHAAARLTASAQRARSVVPPGSIIFAGFHAAAMSPQPPHAPVARPARKAAPSVVASSTGDTSTGRWVASARACTNV